MKMFMRATLAITAAISLTGAAGAGTVLFDNLGPGDTYDAFSGWTVGFPENWELGPGFVMPVGGDYQLTSITAALVWFFEGPNEVTLSVYDNDSGIPGNLLEAVTMTNLPDWGGNDDVTTFNFSGTTVLEAGETYWVAASAPIGSEMGWMDNITGDIGLHAQRAGDGPWQSFNDIRGAIRVEGALIPAPPAALALLSIAGLTGTRRRRS